MERPKLISSRERLLPKEIQAAMDSIAYDYELESAHGGLRKVGPMRIRASAAAERSFALRRLLLFADLGAAAVGGLLVTLLFGISAPSGLVLTGSLMLGSVVLAFFFGLYSDGDLWTWASGLTDAPRALVAGLLLSWPRSASAPCSRCRRRPLVALVATAATVGVDSDRPGRRARHRPPPACRCASGP